MIRYQILTATRASLLVPRAIVAGLVLPWMAEISIEAGSMRPAPYLAEFPHYGRLVDVVATRWVGGRVDICYPLASRVRPTEPMIAISTLTGREGVVYGWAPTAVAPPADLLKWAEWDESERLDSNTIGHPVGPRERLAGGHGRRVPIVPD